MNRVGVACCSIVAAMTLGALVPVLAQAQRAYVANSAAASVSVFDTATNSPQGSIAVGSGPTDVAITPDGSRVYVANTGEDTVTVISTVTGSAITTIPVGDEPRGLAVTPDGSRVYVANANGNSVSVIATATNSPLGVPITVGSEPEGIAITPDGLRAFVAQRGGDIAVVELATGTIVGSISDALGPSKVVVTPDGTRGFVTNENSNSVTIFNVHTGTILGVPVMTGANPSGIALSSNGPVYATSPSDNTVVAIDPVSHARTGPPIPGFAGPTALAATADGAFAYVTNSAASSVSVVDASSASVKGQVPVGAAPGGIAIVPDQPPRAAFATERVEKQGQLLRFDAASSTDPDGQIAIYSWDFGDGQSESGPSGQVEHTYARPGSYEVSLTVTDTQGCSTTFVFTGQTASCNGSGIARTTVQVRALDTIAPAFRLSGARRQALGSTVRLGVRCPKEDCSVSIAGRLSTVKKVRGQRGSSHVPIAKARASIPSGGKATVKLRLTRRAFRAARDSLRVGGRAKLTVKATARDVVGNKSRRKITIELMKVSSQ